MLWQFGAFQLFFLMIVRGKNSHRYIGLYLRTAIILFHYIKEKGSRLTELEKPLGSA